MGSAGFEEVAPLQGIATPPRAGWRAFTVAEGALLGAPHLALGMRGRSVLRK